LVPRRPTSADVQRRKPHLSRVLSKVSDGTRTRDRLDHNQELYLLSYAHHVPPGATNRI
jgi:hypothetical protein